jgi:hypothetical protein
VQTKVKRTLLLAAALLGAVVGCGGDGTGGAVTYTYASAEPISVAAGTCSLVWGPEDVGNGWMHYAIDDLGAGTDAIRAVIISDSFFFSEECKFTAGQPILDETFTGSMSGDIGSSNFASVFPDTYDFVVSCGNSDADCAFNLTWTATY